MVMTPEEHHQREHGDDLDITTANPNTAQNKR
jgi:hypothetical protein